MSTWDRSACFIKRWFLGTLRKRNDVFKLCETIGSTQWYIAKQESHAGPSLDSVSQCLKGVRKMGK